ncbi:HD domain-containing protein [Enterococcus rivorum]|uniref:HD domain-containing protein n=1 Tax=Enterococcus rivorum TaxID=762845 RepID=A0A1E5KSZ4_9ENTE|nr:HD domain-containing protein [Enterococcus rivorum]MBP2098067.1 hypothetical protein [Enterococcus rivorum]OEH81012.1 hypothetical protein BCR26_05725 [Enterococcus rivorum]
MTTYYSVNKHLPSQDDWTTDQFQILNDLVHGTGDTLFERNNDHRVFAFPQYQINDVKKLTVLHFKEESFFSLINYFNEMDNFGLFKDSVIAHGNSHGIRVAWLCMIVATIDQLPLNQTLILVIAGLFHDVGRTWQNLNDQFHGEKSYSRFAKALSSSEEDYNSITARLNHILYKVLELSSPLSLKDIKLLQHIISIHSLNQRQKIIYGKSHSLLTNNNFKRLTMLFDDCDALDRVRFEGNLNIQFLNTKNAKSLIHYAKQIQKIL